MSDYVQFIWQIECVQSSSGHITLHHYCKLSQIKRSNQTHQDANKILLAQINKWDKTGAKNTQQITNHKACTAKKFTPRNMVVSFRQSFFLCV